VFLRRSRNRTLYQDQVQSLNIGPTNTTREQARIQLLDELGYMSRVQLHSDNPVTIHVASTPVFHEENKHIEVLIVMLFERR